MDIKEVEELIHLMEKSSLSEFSIKEGNLEISMKRDAKTTLIEMPSVEKNVMLVESKAEEEEEDLYILSPMVGVFYNSPSPDQTSFVNVGDTVRKGQTLCIIEAMKLMNEIECEYDAEIVSVMVSNEQKVEYGQALFKVRKI